MALFATCWSTGNVFATLCSSKGPKDLYSVKAVASWIWELGHAWLILQSDGEPSLVALLNAVRDRVIANGRAEQVVCQASPVASSGSNGGAERAVQQVRAARTHPREGWLGARLSSGVSLVELGSEARCVDLQPIPHAG